MDVEPKLVVQTLKVDSNPECFMLNKNEELLKLSGQLALKLIKLFNFILVVQCVKFVSFKSKLGQHSISVLFGQTIPINKLVFISFSFHLPIAALKRLEKKFSLF